MVFDETECCNQLFFSILTFLARLNSDQFALERTRRCATSNLIAN